MTLSDTVVVRVVCRVVGVSISVNMAAAGQLNAVLEPTITAPKKPELLS
jgi:hypothetical protein